MNTVYLITESDKDAPLAVSLPGIPREGETLTIGTDVYTVSSVTWRVAPLNTRSSGVGSAFILISPKK